MQGNCLGPRPRSTDTARLPAMFCRVEDRRLRRSRRQGSFRNHGRESCRRGFRCRRHRSGFPRRPLRCRSRSAIRPRGPARAWERRLATRRTGRIPGTGRSGTLPPDRFGSIACRESPASVFVAILVCRSLPKQWTALGSETLTLVRYDRAGSRRARQAGQFRQFFGMSQPVSKPVSRGLVPNGTAARGTICAELRPERADLGSTIANSA